MNRQTADDALDAYWRFFEMFNTREPANFTSALQFPHVRVSARGGANVLEKAQQHTNGMSYERILNSGWDHSVGATPELLHVSDDKVHIKGGWTRYDKDNKPILTNHVTYIVTRVNGRWGVQSRFGVDPGPDGETDEHTDQAIAVVKSLFGCLGSDNAAAADCFNYPHLVIDPARVQNVGDAQSMPSTLPRASLTLNDARALQSGPTGVNVAVEASARDVTWKGVLLVTDRGGHWGVQSRSLIRS